MIHVLNDLNPTSSAPEGEENWRPHRKTSEANSACTLLMNNKQLLNEVEYG
jgi:hypothetical protein